MAKRVLGFGADCRVRNAPGRGAMGLFPYMTVEWALLRLDVEAEVPRLEGRYVFMSRQS